MYQSTWRCRQWDRGCFPVARVRQEHPATTSEPAPFCTDHDEPMVLANWHELEPKPKPKPVSRWRKGGVKNQRVELF